MEEMGRVWEPNIDIDRARAARGSGGIRKVGESGVGEWIKERPAMRRWVNRDRGRSEDKHAWNVKGRRVSGAFVREQKGRRNERGPLTSRILITRDHRQVLRDFCERS